MTCIALLLICARIFSNVKLRQRDKTKAKVESLRDEVKEMSTNFKKLEADVSIIKTVNNLLMKKSVDIKGQCWGNAQYSRRKCLDITGMPASMPQQNFKEKVCQIFNAIGVSLDKNDIDDGHRLRDK